MKIAQVAPLYESVPPKLYGGTERVVSYLTEELVDQGHDVTLFASADSITAAELRPQSRRALRLEQLEVDPLPDHLLMLSEVIADANEFDVIHFHTGYLQLPLLRLTKTPAVTTMHGRMDIPSLQRTLRAYRAERFVSISDHQRGPATWLGWERTIYHGLPHDYFELVEEPGSYLAFLGRISPEKRVDRAIEIAKRAGIPLRVAAKVDPYDQEYFEAEIRPLLDDPLVEYVGEISDAEKGAFLGNARALLFPIDWPEPFGLVMIEAMACGTPVIAYPMGSVPEILTDGKTGRHVRSIDEAVRAVEAIDSLSRRRCREEFEERFTARRMAQDHVALYRHLMEAPRVADCRLDAHRIRSLLGTPGIGAAR